MGAAMWSASVIRDPSACQGLWGLVFHKDNCRTLFGFTRSHLRKKGTKQNRTEGTFRFNQYSPFHNYISDNLHKGGQGQFDSKGLPCAPVSLAQHRLDCAAGGVSGSSVECHLDEAAGGAIGL